MKSEHEERLHKIEETQVVTLKLLDGMSATLQLLREGQVRPPRRGGGTGTA